METQNKTAGKTATESIGVTEMQTFCYNCGRRINQGQRWYHSDQDDLVCQDCAKELKHTDTAYAGSYVKDMPIETIRTSKLFKVVVCQCGRLQEHQEVTEYADCTYESSKILSDRELKEAIRDGYVTPEIQNSCEDCALEEQQALWEEH